MAFLLAHTLFFVRHGQTDWNAAGRLQGQTDTQLNARGCAQAVQAGRTLAKLVRKSPDSACALDTVHFVSSPLTRCVDTMAHLRETVGLTPLSTPTDPRLQEIGFGDWQGKTWSQVVSDHSDLVEARKRQLWTFQPPNGESYAELAARVEAALAELPGNTLMVSHGGVGRVLLCLIGGVVRHQALTASIPQGRVLVFQNGRADWV